MNDSQEQFNPSDFPPSALFVLKIIEIENNPIRQEKIISKTRLNERTARKALSDLKEEDIIASKPSLADPRSQKYYLTDEFKDR